MAAATSSLSASAHALVPSENWDDDFEFQASAANSPSKLGETKMAKRYQPNDFATPLTARMSVASSQLTEDWDAENLNAESPRARRKSGSSDRSRPSKSSIPPALAKWAEEDDDEIQGLPPRRLFADVTSAQNVTENWDDDFEDRIEHSPAKMPKASVKSDTVHESWDEEFGLGPPPRRRQTPRKKRIPPKPSSSGSERESGPLHHHDSSDEDEDAEFGFYDNEREEDKTVTARSRRSALARLSPPPPTASSSSSPPPPVPSIPSPFLVPSPTIPVIPSSSSPHPFPAPRSPTSSVFSVPTTIGGADARSYTSTTHLRATISRGSSGHGHNTLSQLPPSPPIHKSRERRRLRKKSRPAHVTNGVYEMRDLAGNQGRTYPYAYAYSFSDGELEEIKDVEEDDRDRLYSRSGGGGAVYNPPRTPSPRPSSGSAAYLQNVQPMSLPVTPSRSASATAPIGVSTSTSGDPVAVASSSYASSSNLPAPVPSTPSSTRAGALLSRIGSVTRKGWGVRRKRGSSVSGGDGTADASASSRSPEGPISPPRPSLTSNQPVRTPQKNQRHLLEQEQQLTPRPRSSLSSLHHSNSRSSSHNQVHGAHRRHHPQSPAEDDVESPISPAGAQQHPPTSSNWFFRSTSNTSEASNSLTGCGGRNSSRSGSLSDLSLRERERERERDCYTPAGETSGSGAGSGGATSKSVLGPLTPSKLIKRKSLGFVQLRRGFGGHNSGENENVSGESGAHKERTTPNKRPMSMAVVGGDREQGGSRMPSGGRGGQPRHASYGTASGMRERKKSVVDDALGRPRPGSRSSANTGNRKRGGIGAVDTTDVEETDFDHEMEQQERSFDRSFEKGKEKEKSGGSIASGVRAFMGNVRRLSIVGGGARAGAEGNASGSPSNKSPIGKHQRTKSGASIPVKSILDAVGGRGSRSNTPTAQQSRPLTPSTSYPHLASAVGLSGMAKKEELESVTLGRAQSQRRRSTSRSASRAEHRSESRNESRPGSRSGLMISGVGRTTSPTPTAPSAMSSRQVSSGSNASTGTGNASSIPMPPATATTVQANRRRSGSASSASNRRSSITLFEDNQKTPKASKVQHYPPKTPDKVPPLPLLPPIELHPPSPPRLVTEDEEGRYQSMGVGESAASPPVSSPPDSSAMSPSSSRSLSPIASIASPSASPKTIKDLSSSAMLNNSPRAAFPSSSTATGAAGNKLSVRPPVSPGQLQSASLGRSTVSSIVAGNGSVSGNSSTSSTGGGNGGSGGGGGGAVVLRRNSLGDLKIPARISQAQSSLRRDLGMVREFAGHVEHMKTLQSTYDALVAEVQALLETHAAGWYAHQQEQQRQSLVAAPRTTSPNFFNNLVGSARSGALKVRRRSYTNPDAAGGSSDVLSTASPTSPVDSSLAMGIAAYKDLATAFYSINSKYRISWECAELLVELGSGSNGGTSATTSPSKQVTGLGIGQSMSASVSTTAVHVPLNTSELRGKRSRERAITLAGDESRPSTPSGIALPSHSYSSQPQPQSGHSQPHQPPLASPPSWRASTGRHDLSQRQLTLLKEMLNNPEPVAASAPPSGAAIPEESPSLSVSTSSPVSGLPSASSLNVNLNVNRDWRWGNDPMGSTVTLPSEDDSMATGDHVPGVASPDGGPAKKKKPKLNMSGFRDMLRALRRGGGVIDTSIASPSQGGPVYNAAVLMGSTASLSMESSADGHSVFQRQPSQARSTQRRPRTSEGGVAAPPVAGASTTDLSEQLYSPPHLYTGPKLPPKSPRRPSLASIFRIGIGGKNKGGASGSLPTSEGATPGSVPESTASSRIPSGTSSTGDEGPRRNVVTDDGGEEAGPEDGEEDWDQIDSASDLEGHPDLEAVGKSYGSLSPTGVGLEGSGTIRASSTSRGKKLKKSHSPYLQQDPYAARSTSGFSFTGKRSASASQVSLNLSSDSSSVNVAGPSAQAVKPISVPQIAALTTPRPIRLSNVQESQGESPVWPTRTLGQGHPPQSKLNQEASPYNRSVSGSSSKFQSGSKTGSVRSMPPQPILVPSPSNHPRPQFQGQAPPTLALTPENIRPLLENAREVQLRLNHCIAEVQALLTRAKGVAIPARPSPQAASQ